MSALEMETRTTEEYVRTKCCNRAAAQSQRHQRMRECSFGALISIFFSLLAAQNLADPAPLVQNSIRWKMEKSEKIVRKRIKICWNCCKEKYFASARERKKLLRKETKGNEKNDDGNDNDPDIEPWTATFILVHDVMKTTEKKSVHRYGFYFDAKRRNEIKF